MKHLSRVILAVIVLSSTLWLLASASQTETVQDPEVQFQRAVQLETIEGNLNAAIDLYKQVINNNGNNRAIAAKALLRLGGCYEKQGDAEATKAYEQLLRDYADQSEQVKEARNRLAALDGPESENKESTLATRLVWLTGNQGNCRNASSPDGKYMTYVDFESGNLAVRDLKAETSRLLTNEGNMDSPYQQAYSSRWSHDGKQIAYNWEKQFENGQEIQLRVLALEDPKPRVISRGDLLKRAFVEPQDWSPDGKQILVRISHEGQPDQLALIPIQGGSPKVIKTIEPGAVFPGMAFFSPDGRYVVYDRLPGKGAASDLFIVDVTGGDETPLIRHPADDRLLGWSPNGNWILFLSDRSGTPGLWVIRVSEGKPQGSPVCMRHSVSRLIPLGLTKDGSFYYIDTKGSGDIYTAGIDFNTGKLTTPPEKAIRRYEGWNMTPRYSPDGKSLAYISKRGLMTAWPPNRGNALCIRSLENGTERVFMDEFVSLGVRRIIRSRWSPDGRSLAVAGESVMGSGYYLVNLDTGKISTLIEFPPDVVFLQYVFAPDGQHFLYLLVDRKLAILTVHSLDLQNGTERELYRSEKRLGGLAISPDGKWLATTIDFSTLSVIPTGGGAPRTVHHFDQVKNIMISEWTPDGKYIIVAAGQPGEAEGTILYKVPAQGGDLKKIVVQQAIEHAPAVHPDGLRIAFESRQKQSNDAEVWVIQNFLPN